MLSETTLITIQDVQSISFCVRGVRAGWETYYNADTRPSRLSFREFLTNGATIGWFLEPDSPYKNNPYILKLIAIMEERACQQQP